MLSSSRKQTRPFRFGSCVLFCTNGGSRFSLACQRGRSRAKAANGLMARKLKTYQTSLGFFDMAIAVPSMKAALEAWGSKSNLFHQGFAREVDDPDVIAATMSKPGVILRRPVGSDGPFKEDADLPSDLSREKVKGRPQKASCKARQAASSARWTIRQPARPHWHMRESSGSAKASGGRKRPPGRKSVSAGSWRSRRPRRRLKKPSGPMNRGWARSISSALLSKHARRRKTALEEAEGKAGDRLAPRAGLRFGQGHRNHLVTRTHPAAGWPLIQEVKTSASRPKWPNSSRPCGLLSSASGDSLREPSRMEALTARSAHDLSPRHRRHPLCVR